MAEAEDTARTKGFVQALMQEARAILPQALDPARLALLEEHLGSRVGEYVLSYQNLGRSEVGGASILRMDVAINRQALKQELQRLGVYYTASEFLPFSLELQDVPVEKAVEVSLLQTLTGVRREEGATPVFTLSHGEGAWAGRLRTDDREFAARSEDLGDLWRDLWARYFIRKDSEQAGRDADQLIVSGWYSPDGVRSFDKLLHGWQDAVNEASLARLSLSAEGIEGRWNVELQSRHLLTKHLDDYVSARQLHYRLEAQNATVQALP